MRFAEQLGDYVNAAFSGLWIHSHECDEAQREIVRLSESRHWRLAVWDIASGLRLHGQTSSSETGPDDPLAALRALPALATSDGTRLVALAQLPPLSQ